MATPAMDPATARATALASPHASDSACAPCNVDVPALALPVSLPLHERPRHDRCPCHLTPALCSLPWRAHHSPGRLSVPWKVDPQGRPRRLLQWCSSQHKGLGLIRASSIPDGGGTVGTAEGSMEARVCQGGARFRSWGPGMGPRFGSWCPGGFAGSYRWRVTHTTAAVAGRAYNGDDSLG